MAIFRTSDLTINSKLRTTSYNKKAIELPSLSFDLLIFLVENHSRINSIEDIIKSVWKNNVSDETVTQRIALIRKELKKSGVQNKVIESVRGQGYRWLPSVTKVSDSSTKNTNKTKILSLIIIAILISVLGIRYFDVSNNSKQTAQTTLNEQSKEFIKQGQFYLTKFDAASNDIAIELFDKALQAEPRSIEALIGQSIAYSHEMTKYNGAESLGAKAIQLASLASELAPNNSKSWSSLGYAYDAIGDINSAIAYYQKSLALNSNDTSVQASLAYLLMIKGHLFDSLELNIKSIDGKHHYRFLQVAQALEFLGFVNAAEEWYIKSLNFLPDNVLSISTYAKFLYSQRRIDEALSTINESISKGYLSADIYVIKSLIHLEKQQIKQSVTAIQKAVSINNKLQYLTWQLLVNAKGIDLSIESLSELNNSINENHNNVSWPELFISFAIIKSLAGERQSALEMIHKAIELGYRNKAFLLRVGTLLNLSKESKFNDCLNRIEVLVEQERNRIAQQAWLPKELLN